MRKIINSKSKFIVATISLAIAFTFIIGTGLGLGVSGKGYPVNPNTSGAVGDVRVVIDGTEITLPDAKPYIDKSNRTMVPVRVVSENLGAKVDWNAGAKAFKVTSAHAVTRDIVEIVGVANNPKVNVNGVNKYLDPNNTDVVVVVKDSRTYVPLRFFSEELGYEVSYKNRVVYINTPGTPVIELPEIPKVDGEVKYTGQKDFAKDVAKYIPGMTSTGSDVDDQSHLGTNGSSIIVGPTNPYDSSDNGFDFLMVINGWNIPGRTYTTNMVKEAAETMKTTKEIFALYTSEYEKVYREFDSYMKSDADTKTIKTKEGRTFKFDYESAGAIIRIK